MPFVQEPFRIERPRLTLPVRGYIHTAGFEDTHGGSFEQAARSLSSQLESIQIHGDTLLAEAMSKADYGIAVAWATGAAPDPADERRCGTRVDLMVYSDIAPWPGNPDAMLANLHGGKVARYVTDRKVCGDVLMLLGREEAWRRTQPNLETYLQNPPDISDLIAN